jgi:transcriptional regulator with XRE-family HTH domain
VTWARTEAGWDLVALAERLGVEPELLASWESGDAKPTKTQFDDLVRVLRRPTSVFFLPTPPEHQSVTPMFRAALGATAQREPTQEERDAIRTAQRLQRVTGWISEQAANGAVNLPDARGMSPSTAAERTRGILEWDVDQQTRTPARTP